MQIIIVFTVMKTTLIFLVHLKVACNRFRRTIILHVMFLAHTAEHGMYCSLNILVMLQLH